MVVVGIGGSAGAIAALQEFFRYIPADSGVAFVVIMHLSPDHESHLAEVIQKSAAIPVSQIARTAALDANHVYVVPPNKTIEIVDGHALVSDITRTDQRRSLIDIFFRALADAHREEAVAVLLSGTGRDGSAGVKRIREYGGLVLVQDPAEAEYPDMPRSAMATGVVDAVLGVDAIAAQVLAFRDASARRAGADERTPEPHETDALRDAVRLLRIHTGHDFSNYKAGTLLRRLERRRGLAGFTELRDYVASLRDRPDEATALMRDLLISVTSFFRDADVFAAIEQRVMPRLFENKTPLDQVRIWVPGCATGEEAYSLAILAAEYAQRHGGGEGPPVQVFGSDLDEEAIVAAREGFYTEADVADVSAERLQRFFTAVHGGYRIKHDVRRSVVFAHHNLLSDPPFAHLDLISCRNLLIYLNRSVQDRVLETFHFALRSGGYLLLGTSETPEPQTDLFDPVDKRAHLYQGRTTTGRRIPPLAGAVPPRTAISRDTLNPARIMPADLHQRLLDEYAGASLVVNARHEILHVSDAATRYLRAAPGEPSRDLFRMAREELRVDLRHALNEALHRRAQVEVSPLRVRFETGDETVQLQVRPVFRPVTGEALFLILLAPVAAAPQSPQHLPPRRDPGAAGDDATETEVANLKVQLAETIEQYESQAELAKAAYEELQAMNEELRSAAEELETSKEELQSVNEELTTVNHELKIKVEELGLANSDFQNLINSTDVGTIFLDRHARLKLSTPRAGEVFNLRPADIGRPLSDLAHSLKYNGLHTDIANVLEKLQVIDREVESRDGRWYLLRVLPYRTTDDRIDGVVITFQDITARREADRLLQSARDVVEQNVSARTAALREEIDRHATAQLQVVELLREVVRAQEDERARIARDLHDELGQQLTALRLALARHRDSCPSGDTGITGALDVIDRIDTNVNFLARELRPPELDNLGLAAALGRHVREWAERTGVHADVNVTRATRPLPADVEVMFYRIAQEALNNVARHAQATRVDVVLEDRGESTVLIIEDSGRGFDPSQQTGSLGLLGMRERASLVGATLEIESTPGKGTTIFLKYPDGKARPPRR